MNEKDRRNPIKAYLKPAKGLIISDPLTGKPLREEGELKPLSGGPEGRYWR